MTTHNFPDLMQVHTDADNKLTQAQVNTNPLKVLGVLIADNYAFDLLSWFTQLTTDYRQADFIFGFRPKVR